jgi:hypothetical protein
LLNIGFSICRSLPIISEPFFTDKALHKGKDLRVAAEVFPPDASAKVLQFRLKGGDELHPGMKPERILPISQALQVKAVDIFKSISET